MAAFRSALVNPEAAAKRAVEALGHPTGDADREAIRELAHGLGSLARQHNELVRRLGL
jgi:hypothetical protein